MQNPSFKKFKEHFASLSPLKQAGFFLWPSLKCDKISDEEKNLLSQIQPSGMVFFKRNFLNLAQAQELISEVRHVCERKNSPFPMPFVASIDEEGGSVSRLPPPFPRGKPAEEFYKNNDEIGLKSQILHQAFVAQGIGINCILAPVADILTHEQNPVMKSRCFGEDAETVSRFASVVNKTLLSEGIFSCAKHFPGHGDTETDSHKETSVSHATLETLKKREWIPFQKLIQGKVPFVMAAHISLPEVNGDQTPASLSSKILEEHLRGELHFEGLILSDDLRMNAIEHFYAQKNIPYLKQAACDALCAGCDILLSCHGIEEEEQLAQAISEKLLSDKDFFALMCQKAHRIFKTLSNA